MDRERLADIVVAMDGLDGFLGVFDLRSRVVVGVSDGQSRARAAARLTALSPLEDVEVLIQPTRMPAMFAAAPHELAAATERAEARRAEWETYKVEVDVRLPTRAHRAILVVSAEASSFAAKLRTAARAPIITYAKSTTEHVDELVADYKNLNAIVLDPDLPGADALADQLARKWPWLPIVRTRQDVESALAAGGIPTRNSLAREGVFDGVRILVVDVHGGSLKDEVANAALGAMIESATGSDAIEKLSERDVDLVVAGSPRDLSLPSLVRVVSHSKKTPPLLVIATDSYWRSRMQWAYPKLARYFIERPLEAHDLAKVLRR